MFRRKPGEDAWAGTVTGKSRGMTDGSNMYHYLTVQTADAGALRVRVNRRLWKSVADGDRVVKRAGAHPERA